MFFVLRNVCREGWGNILKETVEVICNVLFIADFVPIRSSDNDNTGFWPPGSLHTLGTDGHI